MVTLPEPAEVGDVVPCPKCEAYFTVPKTKIVPMPGAAKAAPAKPVAAVVAKPKVVVEAEAVDDDEDFVPPPPKKKPVVVVEDDEDEEDEDEEEEKPKKKKKSGSGGGKKKKKKKKDDEKSFKNSPLRYAILGVLVLVMLVGGYFLYKKEWTKPDIIVTKPDEDLSKPITKEELERAKKNAGTVKTGLPSVDRNKALNELKQLGMAYVAYADANGMGPKVPGDLLPFVENNAKLIKDVTDGVYVLTMGIRPALLPQGSSNTILGYVHDVPQKGGVVLFADTAARNVRKDEFDAAPKAGK